MEFCFSPSCQSWSRGLGSRCRSVGGLRSARYSGPLKPGLLAKVTLAMQLLPKTVMSEPRQCDADRLTTLKSELTAIELWESDYYRVQVHDDIDAVAHRNRLERRKELLGEIAGIARPHARVPRLR
jgi:hypothetical protein